MARDLYEAMETARCEAMGARDMPGTAGNIDAKIGHEATRRGYDQVQARPPMRRWRSRPGYLIRHLATGRDLPAGAQNVMELWRGFIEDQAGDTLENLDETLSRPDRLCPVRAPDDSRSGLWRPVGRRSRPDGRGSGGRGRGGSEDDQRSRQHRPGRSGRRGGRGAIPSNPRKTSRTPRRRRSRWTSMADQEMGEEAEMPEGEAPLEPPPPQPVSRGRSELQGLPDRA